MKRGSRKREGRGWIQQRERGGRWNERQAGGGKGAGVAEKVGESGEKRAKREGRVGVEQ